MNKYLRFGYCRGKFIRGVAAVEFLIILSTVFVPLFLGTVEVARVFYQYNSLVKSVRDSARYISMHSATSTLYSTHVGYAKCVAVYGNEACTGSPIVPGLTIAKVSIGSDGNGAPVNAGGAGSVAFKLISVKVTGYRLGYVTAYLVSGDLLFNDISVSMRQLTT